MAKVTVNAGVCGFTTIIETRLEDDGQTVSLSLTTSCPNIAKCTKQLKQADAFHELFSKLHETEIYRTLSPHIPHAACPVYSGILKAIEVAAGMALPVDSSIKVESV